MHYITIGQVEIKAFVVGLVTGFIYAWLSLPIPAPGVLGGQLAIIGTFAGLVIVQLLRGEARFGAPPSAPSDRKETSA